jgi:hypothetical protein
MTFTVELPPAVEAELKACFARGDDEVVRHLLLKALLPEAWLLANQPPLTLEEFGALKDKLAEILEAETGGKIPPSDLGSSSTRHRAL